MCLGIPGRVIEIVSTDFQIATVDVAGVRRAVNFGQLADEPLAVGDWVLIHVGFAIRKMEEAEVRYTTEFLDGLGEPLVD
jgi:hydrogenase expression/formation protein HypC